MGIALGGTVIMVAALGLGLSCRRKARGTDGNKLVELKTGLKQEPGAEAEEVQLKDDMDETLALEEGRGMNSL